MSQNDFNIANQGFPATRADINSALQALASNSAGTAEPSTTYAYQFWYDETNELLKMRNSDNDAWITIGTFDQVADTFTPAGVTSDKIEEGNSSVEVVDTGTGYVAVVVDGVEVARISPTGLNVDGAVTADGLTVDGNTDLGSTTRGVSFRTFGGASYKMSGGNSANATSEFAINSRASSGSLNFQTNDTTRMYVSGSTGDIYFYEDTGTTPKFYWDASTERLGLGTTSPTSQLSVVGANSGFEVNGDSGSSNARLLAYDRNASAYRQMDFNASQHTFQTSGTERCRINSSGQVLVSDVTRTYGNTSSPLYSAGNSDQTSGAMPLELAVASGSGGFRYLAGFSNVSGFIGSISVSGSTTSYNTTSDYRLKENVTPLSGAANRLAQIPVHRFNFISDPDTTVDGFLAHEVQAIVPEAVHGEKDAINADGKPEYQGIDQSKLVPLLTAALQEALTEIESLKARVAALEGA